MCTGADLGSAVLNVCDSRLSDGGTVRDCCRHGGVMRLFLFCGEQFKGAASSNHPPEHCLVGV